jgi:hypothetical protein
MARAFVLSDLRIGGRSACDSCPAPNEPANLPLIASFRRQQTKDVDIHFVVGTDSDLTANKLETRQHLVANDVQVDRGNDCDVADVCLALGAYTPYTDLMVLRR